MKYYKVGIACLVFILHSYFASAGSPVIGVPYETVPGIIYGTSVQGGAINILYQDDTNELLYEGSTGFSGSQAADEFFGISLAVGDFNNDGSSDLAIGVSGDDDSGSLAKMGAVYTLYGDHEGKLQDTGVQRWDQSVSGIPGDRNNLEYFGRSLAVGDFNGDGYDDLVVGIPSDRDTGDIIGGVNIIYGSVSGLQTSTPAAQLFNLDSPGVFGNGVSSDRYGQSLAAGDINGDGYDDLAVGAPEKSVGGNANAGVVSVIYGSASGLNTDAATQVLDDDYLYQGAPNASEDYELNDEFGESLSMGDYNGDGYADLAVGVPGEDHAQPSAGVVQVFWGAAGGLLTTASSDLVLSQGNGGLSDQPDPGDFFGSTLASGNFNNDGYDDLVIGVHKEWITQDDAGAFHVLYGNASNFQQIQEEFWHQDSTGVPGVNETGDFFGFGLAAGDLDDDGLDDLLVGAYSEDLSGKVDAGAVTVFMGTASGMNPVEHLFQGAEIPGDLEDSDRFGFSLAILNKPVSRFPWNMFLPAFTNVDSNR